MYLKKFMNLQKSNEYLDKSFNNLCIFDIVF